MTNVSNNNSQLYKYVDAETLMQMKTYDLRAKVVVQSFLQGLHRSPYHGVSSQFSEYKVYVEGDDLRHLDWKLYARSDRYYIRKYEGETNMQCHILLDLSLSMEFNHAGIETTILSPIAAEELFAKLYDFKILICPKKNDWHLMRIKELSCVSFVMRLIGFYRWWIITPYQLYCALLKAGYKPFWEKRENHGKKNS